MHLTRMLSLLFSLLALASPSLLISCNATGKPEAVAVPPDGAAIKREYRKGPLRARLVVDKDSVTIAESIILTIEAEVEEGFEAELPKFGEKLGEFGIRDYRDEPPHLTSEQKIVSKKTYTLDPFLSGDYTIAPLLVKFRKKPDAAPGTGSRPGDSGSWDGEIATEEIAIKVRSLLPEDRGEPTLNPIRGPVDLPARPIPLLYLLAGLAAAGALAGAAFFLLKRRKNTNPSSATAIPAHEVAFQQLQAIIDERLIERGEIKLFFGKISDVLRGYIENRFGIQAPRRTTEEFLRDISRNAPFDADRKRLLMEFLQDCDLVKFAEYTPACEEIERACGSCRAFIEATREDREALDKVEAKREG